MSTILGCDPGAKGAYCLLVPTEKLARFYPSPGGLVPPGEIYIRLLEHAAYLADRFIIEDVHSLYGMSAKSNFNFGGNVHAAQTIMNILSIGPHINLQPKQLELVQPKTWQRAIGVTAKGKEIKAQVAKIAHKLYPYAELFGPKGGLIDGRADALMIAHYAYLQEQKSVPQVSES